MKKKSKPSRKPAHRKKPRITKRPQVSHGVLITAPEKKSAHFFDRSIVNYAALKTQSEIEKRTHAIELCAAIAKELANTVPLADWQQSLDSLAVHRYVLSSQNPIETKYNWALEAA